MQLYWEAHMDSCYPFVNNSRLKGSSLSLALVALKKEFAGSFLKIKNPPVIGDIVFNVLIQCLNIRYDIYPVLCQSNP